MGAWSGEEIEQPHVGSDMCPCHNQILGHCQHTQVESVGQLFATDPPWEVVSAAIQS